MVGNGEQCEQRSEQGNPYDLHVTSGYVDTPSTTGA